MENKMNIFKATWNFFFNRKKFPIAKKESKMTIGDFAVKVAKKEGGKKSVNIAQIKEILRIVNALVGGELYKIIKKL